MEGGAERADRRLGCEVRVAPDSCTRRTCITHLHPAHLRQPSLRARPRPRAPCSCSRPHFTPTPACTHTGHPPCRPIPRAQALSPLALAGIVGVKALGYLMFRGANSQKDTFRRDPNHPRVARLRTLKTERGTQLIISGWWGIARHINYFGDWLMA